MKPGERGDDPIVAALRRAGCVFAEDEARILREAAANRSHLEELLAARVSGAPLEQVVGQVDFGSFRLRVGPGVFVPRQRTLYLAALAAQAVLRAPSDDSTPVFVEAFAGAAPLAAWVREAVPHAEAHVTDIDERALSFARANLGAEPGVHQGDVLTGLPGRLRGRVGVIAAVPPYVPDAEAELLPREAREFEPSTALFGGHDGLELTRALIEQSPQWLTTTGTLLVEMNEGQVATAARFAADHGFSSTPHHADDGQTVVLDLTVSSGSDAD